ncbi:hypothetical protein [Cytobacillus depressus]|nr:hypothetical protein [Cytobacillus depressus]
MFLKRFNRTGKILAFIGVWVAAIGITFNKTIGVPNKTFQNYLRHFQSL